MERIERNLQHKLDLTELDTYNGKLHVAWDEDAQVTPLGQLSFFIQYMKMGNLFGNYSPGYLKYSQNILDRFSEV